MSNTTFGNSLSLAGGLALGAGLLVPAAGAWADVTVLEVFRYTRTNAYIHVPPDHTNSGESFDNTTHELGPWNSGRDLGYSADGGAAGMASALSRVTQSSDAQPTSFIFLGQARLELNSTGVCSADAYSESNFEVTFEVTETTTARVHGTLTFPGGVGQSLSFSRARLALVGSEEDILNTSVTHDETFVLEPGTYLYWATSVGTGLSFGAFAFTDTVMEGGVEFSGGGCDADFNGDNQADFFDYLDFAAAFDAEDASADFTGDQQVDFFDYLDFVAAFDVGC
jgi:hypothetical protein